MNRRREEIDLEVYYPRNSTDISGEDRLKFAKQLLLCLFFVCSYRIRLLRYLSRKQGPYKYV